ncbi:MAG TPA: GH92 family glycosyl hydrolase, partial [Thermoleophilaceae bacterium]
MRRSLLTILALALTLAAPASAQERDLASYADPMVGTGPPGFVFPGAVVPFGMVQNSPDTRGEFAYSGYLYADPQIQGFSLVHISGPGVRKGGDIPLMPTVGPVNSNDPVQYGSPFDHAREEAEPGYYRVHLAKYATDVELTASTRAAMQRYTFPPSPQSNVIVDVGRSVEGVHSGQIRFTGPDEISGYSEGRYRVYFVAKFSRPFASTGTFKPDGEGAGGWATFNTLTDRQVTARIGISFVDAAGARRNLEADAPTFDFDRMRARAREAWNRELGRLNVSGGTDLERTTFYSALYHSSLHPNVFSDVDGRYMGFDKQPHRAEGRTQYANFSSWDLYKSTNQLLATLQPRRYRDMLLTLLANYREWGRLPRWGEHYFDANHMSGDPAIPMIADGLCRGGILSHGEAEDLLEASNALYRRREASLQQLGYLPDRPGTTLEFGVADFALALLADAVGHDSEAKARLTDSLRYRTVLDPETRWVRPRHADGSWYEPFDPTDTTGFQEGNSWQYSWLAPHDARGLYDRMGGDAAAIERLDQYFSAPPEAANQLTFFGIVYKAPWHAPGNEHDLQVPWMYPFVGQPWKTMSEHREIQRLFRPEPNGLPGNDDLGGLSSWLTWSMLGIGPVTPGAPFYVIGSPTFERAVITPDGGSRFAIEAPGASPLRPYVTAASVGGRRLGSAWLYDASVRRGETVKLTVAEQPNTEFGSAPPVRPPSVSDSPLARFGCLPTAPQPDPVAPGAAERPAGFEDPRTAPVEPGPVLADGSAPPSLVPLRLRVSPRTVRTSRRTLYRLTVHAKRHGRWVPVRGARVRLAGVRARTSGKGVAKIRATIRHHGTHRANATAAAARPAYRS